MPSRSAFSWLLEKEWHELVSSRAWWVLLVLMGPLVGQSFISAATTYAELSGYGGSTDGVGEAFSPLVGIWAPTFSACELAAAFLLPFVAIRLVAGDRQSGALKLEVQHAMPAAQRVAAKALVLLAGWLIASIPAVAAVALWRSYGGFVYVPELSAVVAGHLLNAGLTVGLAFAAAAITEHPATAAIVTLSVTIGTWILNFVAAVQGGVWERAAGYTPTAMVSEFQHGLVRADVTVAAILLTVAGLAVAAIWTRLGASTRRNTTESGAVALLAATALMVSTYLTPAWDVSEARLNSFRPVDEQLLRSIPQPLRVEVHLAPEDPRRVDFERRVLSKLRRVMTNLRIDYVSKTSTGLFEQSDEHYGEIWYEVYTFRTMTRATTVESALEEIFEVCGLLAPTEAEDDVFRGHPLPVPPQGASVVFYGFWPAVVGAAAVLIQRRKR